ncbi:hypothetical protein [Methanosarcina horonobensis]|uniref:hypothetical protein n=1 Tax=Methanosarcina horonobensis TaxID=418008 RepID=UPI000A7998CB|nr:hypothetical protein [Methanosarcina horonobensis]
MIGAPVKAYVPELREFIDADIRVPEFHEVGNAAGALAGNIIKRSEILIRPVVPEPSNTTCSLNWNGKLRIIIMRLWTTEWDLWKN